MVLGACCQIGEERGLLCHGKEQSLHLHNIRITIVTHHLALNVLEKNTLVQCIKHGT